MSKLHVALITLETAAGSLARIIGRQLPSLTPDAIVGPPGSVSWQCVQNWEAMTDEALAATTGLTQLGLQGSLIIVTEASFTPGRGALMIDSSDLAALVSEHLSLYGECFFNGDVIVAEIQGARVWLFHHEGACCVCEGS